MARAGDEAREALLDAAEHIFAIQGIETASLRDIAFEAGQRNNYAVQYHFGDRSGLVAAVFTRRMDAINEQRLRMIADLDSSGSHDLRDLAAALMMPLINYVTSTNSWYGRFLLRTEFDHFAVTVKKALPVSLPVLELTRRIDEALSHLPRNVRHHRVGKMMTHYIGAVADWEWSRDRRKLHLTIDELKQEVLSTSCAILMAPASVVHSTSERK